MRERGGPAEMLHPTDALEAGADGVIDKFDVPERVFDSIRGPGGGQAYSPEWGSEGSVRAGRALGHAR